MFMGCIMVYLLSRPHHHKISLLYLSNENVLAELDFSNSDKANQVRIGNIISHATINVGIVLQYEK